jgi:SAM-dependent methyltransferase
MVSQSVKDFYDNEGWRYSETNSHDALINENLTLVAAEYVSKVRRRIFENVGSGKSLLDIGCGPIQYDEYLEYSKNFDTRVCVDLSTEALRLAKIRIGERGHFIVGDYLDLAPLLQAPFDGATLINVLYHVEKEKQELLVRKILNDLNPGANLIVVYSNPNTLSAEITRLLVVIKKYLRRFFYPHRQPTGVNPIYFYRYPLTFWNDFDDVAEVYILAWRTFSPPLERLLFRKWLFGKYLLRKLFTLEQSGWWARLAEYPMIILTKK